MATSSKTSTKLLAIIVALFFPPVGLAIHEGVTRRFWICLLLTIIFFVPGLIYALWFILK